jgi:hypothetical protein
MPELYAFALGPVPLGPASTMLYGALHDGQILSIDTDDVDEALADLRAAVPAGTRLRCAPELATPGAHHGFVGSPPTDEVREALALAALTFVQRGQDTIGPGAAVCDFVRAAAAFWAARVWEHVPADVGLPVAIAGSTRKRAEAAVMGANGEEYGLVLFQQSGAVARVRALVDARRFSEAAAFDMVSVSFEPEPAFAAAAIEAWWGRTMIPHLLGTRKAQQRAVGIADVTILTATMNALTHANGTPGEILHGTAADGQVRVTVRVPTPR